MLAPAAEAQSDRAEWLAWRAGKEARYARVTPNPQRDVLVLTGIRAFPDPSGHIVIVGEARNAAAVPLAYARVHFTFHGSDGRTLGTAEAQSDRAAWLAWRTGKEARSRA